MDITEKEQALMDFFDNQRVLIAFSGGVDSTLLAATAVSVAAATAVTASATATTGVNDPALAQAAGANTKMLAVTIKTELVSDREIESATETAKELGINHLLIEKSVLGLPEIENNRQNRCFICKREILMTLLDYAEKNGYETVVEGTNYSDKLLSDKNTVPRPGLDFILKQKEIQNNRNQDSQNQNSSNNLNSRILPKLETPLLDLEITKEEIREMAKRKKLAVAEKPSMSCLATRFSYDTKLNSSLLKTIEAAEEMAGKIGAKQIRIRVHTDSAGRNIARIEVEKSEIGIFLKDKNQTIVSGMISFLKQNGFSYVTVDLEGFRSGSMDI
jgi:uncharacterized protein